METKKAVLTFSLIFLAVGLAIGAASATFYFTQIKKPNLTETQVLGAKISKLMQLPQEEPTLATVTDKTQLANQPFFAKAENGDKVLIFAQAQKAILYRPSENKVIEVGPIENQAPPTTATPPPQTPLRIVLYNGTQTGGLTQKAEKALTDKSVNIEVISRSNAAANDHENTLLVNLANVDENRIKEITGVVKSEISPLPAGEIKPEGVDLLLILGQDFAQ